MLARFFLSVILLLPAFALGDKVVAPDDVPGATKVTAEQVVELFHRHPDLVVIDSRRAEEYAKGHIEGALSLLDVNMTEQALAKAVPGKHVPVVFYCNGERCARSSNAAQKAVVWGYSKVYWFRGGWNEWTTKQLPISK